MENNDGRWRYRGGMVPKNWHIHKLIGRILKENKFAAVGITNKGKPPSRRREIVVLPKPAHTPPNPAANAVRMAQVEAIEKAEYIGTADAAAAFKYAVEEYRLAARKQMVEMLVKEFTNWSSLLYGATATRKYDWDGWNTTTLNYMINSPVFGGIDVSISITMRRD